MAPSAAPAVALAIRGLDDSFATRAGVVRAVDGIDLEVRTGEVLGLVGESGSGKSVTLRSIVRLVRAPGTDRGPGALARPRPARACPRRSCATCAASEIAMIFQEPMTALNPVLTVRQQIDENLEGAHRPRPGGARAPRDRAAGSGRHPVGGRAPRRLSAPVLGRHAPARDDRDRAGERAQAAAGGRADHRARRHHPGPDPEAAAASCATGSA